MAFPPRDTDLRAHEVQMGIYRRMGGARRAGLGAEMSDEMCTTLCAGIRSRHPHYDEVDVQRALRKLLLGEDLVRRAWPDEPLRDP